MPSDTLPDHPDVVRGMATGYPRGEPIDRDERDDDESNDRHEPDRPIWMEDD